MQIIGREQNILRYEVKHELKCTLVTMALILEAHINGFVHKKVAVVVSRFFLHLYNTSF